MKQESVRVLVLEDNPADFSLLKRTLISDGIATDILRAESRAQFLGALAGDVDVILADHSLPDFSSADALTLLQDSDLDVPFIIVSGTITGELAVRLLRRGAADYVLKDRLARLGPAVRNALRERDLRRDKADADRASLERNVLQESVLASLSAHIAVVDGDGRIVAVNKAWTNFARENGDADGTRTGVGADYIDVCRTAARSEPTAQDAVNGIVSVMNGETDVFQYEYACHAGNRQGWYQMHVTPYAGIAGGVVISHQDVTDRRRAEESVLETEALFTAVVNSSLDGIVLFSARRDEHGCIDDFEVVRANPRAAEIAGTSPDALHGRPLSDIFPNIKESEAFDLYTRVIETGEPAEIETFFMDGGVSGWFTISAVRVADGLAVTIRDVTRQKEREAALREAKERFDALGQSIPGVIYTFVMEADGTFSLPYVSEGASKLFGIGFDATNCDPLDVLALIHPDDRDDYTACVEASARTLEPWCRTGRFIINDRIRWIYSASKPRRRTDGAVEWDGLAIDITARVEAEAALVESRRHQEALFEQSLDAVVIVDDDGRYVDVNPAACALLQRSRAELREMSIFDLTPEGNQEEEASFWAAFIEHGTMSGEYRVQRPDGSIVDVEYRAVANILDGRHLSVLRDVTARNEAEANRARLAAIVESSNDAIIGSTRDGIIVDWNVGAENLFGYSAQEICGQHHRILLPHGSREEESRILATVRRGEGCRSMEVVRRRKDGRLIDVSLSAAPILNSAGDVVGGSAILRDISAQKEFIRETLSAKQKAEEITRLKSSFLANMSHEIRTPLTGIIGFADILADQVADEQREIATFIANSGERLMETLTSVLDLAQLESGHVKIKLEPVEVDRLARQTLDLLIPQAKARSIELNLEIVGPKPARAFADAAALNRILTNLCTNAVKFTREGRVGVRVVSAGDTVTVEVCDTGVGISPEFLPFIFDEYKQESEGCGRDFEGTGIGLTISKRLADLMNAAISVTSEKGKGSSFKLVLTRVHSRSNGFDSTVRSFDARWQTRRPVLLLVDDNMVMHHLVRLMLSDCCDIDCVADGEAALTLASETVYDAVLLDIDLGQSINGEEVLRRIRTYEGYVHVPIIAATAYALDGDRERFLQAGFDAYVSKPFHKNDLREVLQSALKYQLSLVAGTGR